MFAAHCAGLVVGLGETESRALRDARRNGFTPLHAPDLDVCLITRDAARYVAAGGDCRALALTLQGDGLDLLVLRSSAAHAHPLTPKGADLEPKGIEL